MAGNIIEDILLKEVESCLVPNADSEDNALISIQTIKYRVLNHIMSDLDLTFNHVVNLLSTHTPVHPEIVKELLLCANKQGEFNYLLAQDFIRNDKLMKVLRAMCKNGYTNRLNAILAIDGLGGAKWSTSPNFEMKKYLDNLKYSLSGEQGAYDRDMEDSVKRAHVFAVRRVYQELYQHDFRDNGVLMAGVYRVMCQIFKDVAGIYLPSSHDVPIPVELMRACVEIYKNLMPNEEFMKFINLYKQKNDIAPQKEDTAESGESVAETEEEPLKKLKKIKTNEKLEEEVTKKRKKHAKKAVEEPITNFE